LISGLKARETPQAHDSAAMARPTSASSDVFQLAPSATGIGNTTPPPIQGEWSVSLTNVMGMFELFIMLRCAAKRAARLHGGEKSQLTLPVGRWL